MSYDEFLSWCAYLKKRGPLSLAKRLDIGFARLAVKLDGVMGHKSQMEDYLPYRDQPEDQQATLQNVFSLLKAKAKKAA